MSRLLMRLSICGLVPFFLFVHGYIWHTSNQSNALAIYGMKLSYVVFLLGLILSGMAGKIKIREYIFVGFLLAVFLFSTLVLLLGDQSVYFRYFLGDAAGFLLFILYYISILIYLRGERDGLDFIISLVITGAVFSSLVVVFWYIYSGGNKVSIPPEIHFSSAIALARLFWIRKDYDTIIKVAIILMGCLLSLQSITLLIIAVPIFFLILNVKKAIKLFPILLTFLLFIIYPNYENIKNSMQRLAISSNEGAVFLDLSVNQRLVEADLIFEEMNKASFHNWLFGYGFGAMYKNKNFVIKGKGEYIHHAHISPVSILLRNGLLGCFSIFVLPFILFKPIQFNSYTKLAISGVVSTYVALMADQYIYWGALFAISLAVLSFVCDLKIRRE